MNAWDITLRPWATTINIIFVGLVCVALNACLLLIAGSFTAGPVLDLQLLYTPLEANQFLSVIGDVGRQRYLGLLLTIDLVFPAAYALLLSLLLIRVDPKQQRSRLLWLPLAAAALDWAENFGLVALLVTFHAEVPSNVALFTMGCTLAKWMIVTVSLIALLVGLLRTRN